MDLQRELTLRRSIKQAMDAGNTQAELSARRALSAALGGGERNSVEAQQPAVKPTIEPTVKPTVKPAPEGEEATLWDSVKRGFYGMGEASSVDAYGRNHEKRQQLEDALGSLPETWDAYQQTPEAGQTGAFKSEADFNKYRTHLQDGISQFSDNMEDYRSEAEQYGAKGAALPRNAALDNMFRQDTFGDVVSAFSEAPASITGHLLAESAVPMAEALALGYLGAKYGGGVKGAMVGTGFSSGNTEYYSGVLEGLKEKGIDVTDSAAMEKAFSDKAMMDDIRRTAGIKAGVIGVADGVGMGIAAKQLASTPVKNALAQTVVQVGLGSGGEALGSYASGQEVKPAAVFAEGIAELPGGVLDVAVAAAGKQKDEQRLAQADDAATVRDEANQPHEAFSGWSDPVPKDRTKELRGFLDNPDAALRDVPMDDAAKNDVSTLRDKALSNQKKERDAVAAVDVAGVAGRMIEANPATKGSDDADLKQGIEQSVADNTRRLVAGDVPVNPTNLYLAHHFGAEAPRKLALADKSLPIAEVLGEDVLAEHPYLAKKTVAQAGRLIAGRMNDEASHKAFRGRKPLNNDKKPVEQATQPVEQAKQGLGIDEADLSSYEQMANSMPAAAIDAETAKEVSDGGNVVSAVADEQNKRGGDAEHSKTDAQGGRGVPGDGAGAVDGSTAGAERGDAVGSLGAGSAGNGDKPALTKPSAASAAAELGVSSNDVAKPETKPAKERTEIKRENKASFVPTHELPDGTPVVKHPEDDGVWIDEDSAEWEDSATPLEKSAVRANTSVSEAAHEKTAASGADVSKNDEGAAVSSQPAVGGIAQQAGAKGVSLQDAGAVSADAKGAKDKPAKTRSSDRAKDGLPDDENTVQSGDGKASGASALTLSNLPETDRNAFAALPKKQQVKMLESVAFQNGMTSLLGDAPMGSFAESMRKARDDASTPKLQQASGGVGYLSDSAPDWIPVRNGFKARQYLQGGTLIQEVLAPDGDAMFKRTLDEYGRVGEEGSATALIADFIALKPFEQFHDYFKNPPVDRKIEHKPEAPTKDAPKTTKNHQKPPLKTPIESNSAKPKTLGKVLDGLWREVNATKDEEKNKHRVAKLRDLAWRINKRSIDTVGAGAGAISDSERAEVDAFKKEFADIYQQKSALKPDQSGSQKPKQQFADNTIFTADAVEAARARLKKKLGTVNSGFDPEVLSDGITLAGAYIESGVRSFGDYSKAMIGDLGEGVKPYLLSFYEGVRNYPGLDTRGMDDIAVAKRKHEALLSENQQATNDKLVIDTKQVNKNANTETETTGATGGSTATEAVGVGDPAGARDLSGGRKPDSQPRPAPEDTNDVEADKPDDVGESVENGEGLSGGVGVRTSGTDVAGERHAGSKGDARNGRTGTGGTQSPDARTGGKRGGVKNSPEKKEKPFENKPVPTVKKPETVSPAHSGAGNYHIDDPKSLVGGTDKQRFDKNVKAIELFNTLRDEGRQATREEQHVLAAYTGWGSFGQALFQGSWAHPKPQKGWEKRDVWLREHLSESEWSGMQQSITTAYYTEPPTVQAMWAMLEKFGFKGGRVLEPGMGTGNFFGMMPAHLKSRSQLAGIELDEMTGGIAKLLYPDANINIMGFQDSKTPDDFYDVVIGNVPFSQVKIADRRYNRINPMVHDYFFLKSVDQLRPGGVMMAITSTGTLDKQDAKIRRELAKKAELVGAIRLPGGAFKEYAGTDVMTDIIILKKRAEPIVNVEEEGWINVESPAGKHLNGKMNEFFLNRPDYVLGKLAMLSGQFGEKLGVKKSGDVAEKLNELAVGFKEGIYIDDQQARERISYVANHTDDREGALTKTDKGFHIVRGEYLAPAEEVAKYSVKNEKTTKQREQQFEQLIAMRQAYGELIDAERTQAADTEVKRTVLREQVEAYRNAHKGLNESYGLKYLKRVNDPFYPALASLEVVKPDGTVRTAKILTESTMRTKQSLKNPSIRDAFVLARNSAISPTLKEVAAIAGKPAVKVKAELLKSGAVFETVTGDIEPADLYLSGNVREKLRQAQAAVEAGQDALQRNVEALTAVLPPDIPYFNIQVQLGATWVPVLQYREYVAHMLGRTSTDGIEVSYKAGRWKVRLSKALLYSPEASSGFGTALVDFKKLLNSAFSNQLQTIRRKDSDGNHYIDHEATKEVNSKIANVREKFGEWLWSDAVRRDDLEAEYNETRNSYADPVFDGSFLNFDGMALSLGNGPFNLREHQANAVWRALVKKKSINAHEVGTGKTFTMAGIAVESRRYGLAKKPLIFAHNANSKSVAHEINMMYPAANVLYVDNLSPKTIDVKLRQIANDDWDAVVVPHSLIDKLSFKEETLMQMAQAEIDELEAEAREAAEDDGVEWDDNMLDDPEARKKLRSHTAKDLVNIRNRIIETIKKQAQLSSRADAVSFEDLGVDMVMVDEVHEFKKPPFSTKMKMKGLQTQTSARSIALKFITQFVRNQNNGGNVHTFTGTPVTNTLTEVYHQMRYIMEEEMDAAGVSHWDGWFGSFAAEVEDVELNAAAEYESVVRLAGFINVPELRRMVGQYMDTVFADDMPEMQPRRTASGKTLNDESLNESERAELLKGRTEKAKDRPYKKVIVDTVDLTPAQKVEFERIQGYARKWRDMDSKKKREAMLNGDPESPIIYEGMAAKASFDVRLLDGAELAGKEGQVDDDPSSKASRVVRNVKELYDSHPKATQVVFTQSGIAKTATRSVGEAGAKHQERYKVFSTAHDIIERLVQQGIPREQIALVDGSTSKEKRKLVADLMNKAEIRVVIGSTQSLGVGVNMQRNLRAMHHMDAPWMPGDLEQRNGRGHRQGNQWNTVLEYRYLTDRIDGRRWQVLAVKQRFINAFLKADDGTRVIEGDAATDEESDILATFAEAAGDPRILIRTKLQKKIQRLQDAERMHGKGIADAKRQAKRLREDAAREQAELEQLTAADVPGKVRKIVEDNAGKGFVMQVQGRKYTERKKAAVAIGKLADGMRVGDRLDDVGSFGGYPLSLNWGRLNDQLTIELVIEGETFTGSGSIASLERALRDYGGKFEKRQQALQDKLSSADRADAVSNEPFRRADELQQAEGDYKALEEDLAENPVPPPAWLRSGAPVDTHVFYEGGKYLVTGHRWNAAGWFVLATDANGERVALPYAEVLDTQGMALYEERPFEKPEIQEGATKKQKDKQEAERPVFGEEDRVPSAGAGMQRRSIITASGKAKGIPVGDAERLARDFMAAYNGNIPLELRVAEKQEELYGVEAGQDIIKGAYHPASGVFTLVASNLDNKRDARATIRHEVIGHYGLNTFSPTDKRALLEKVIASRRVPSLREHWEYVERYYPENSELQNAEEVFAFIAEMDKPPRAIWKGLLDLIVRALRAVGLVNGDLVTRTELRQLAQQIAKEIRAGDRRQQNFPKTDQAQFSKRRKRDTGNDDKTRFDSGFSDSGGIKRFIQERGEGLAESLRELRDDPSGVLGDAWQDRLRTVLGGLTLRQLADVGKPHLPQMTAYVDEMQRMLTFRNEMLEEAGTLADTVRSWAAKNRKMADKLYNLMHVATVEGVDPDDYKPLSVDLQRSYGGDKQSVEATPDNLKVWVKSMNQARHLSKHGKSGSERANGNLDYHIRKDAVKKLRIAVAREKNRAALFADELSGAWSQLDSTAKEHYRGMRDLYTQRSGQMVEALLKRVQESEAIEDTDKPALIERIRSEFENPLDENGIPKTGPYFPLQRFGDYYAFAYHKAEDMPEFVTKKDGSLFVSRESAMAAKDRKDVRGMAVEPEEHVDTGTGEVGWRLRVKGTPGFYLFESQKERRRAVRQMRREGWQVVKQGLRGDAMREVEGVSEGFAADVVEHFQKKGDKDGADMVYQMYLETLHQFSIRKKFMHRKATKGFSQDALRAFGFNMMRLGHQVSKLEHSPVLERILRHAEDEGKGSADRTKTDIYLNELKKRHEWVLNPDNSAWTNVVSALGFVWYLGISPAAALVNMSQTAIVAYPVLAAKFGWGRAGGMLTDVTRQVFSSKFKGGLDKALSGDEAKAFAAFKKSGALDRSMAHNLAGISESDSLKNSEFFNKTMHKVAFLFHQAEVINREVTLLSAYRLARKQGMAHDAAVEYATDATWESHFDYSNANRARWMQSNPAKVLLMFRSYSQHMTYFLWRNLYQSFKGESPEVKHDARTKFMGIMGMTGLFAGTAGMPLMGMMYGIANTVSAVFGDDDEPWDAETAFKNTLHEAFPKDVAEIADRGAMNYLTALDWSSRTSLNDLWIRSPDRDLDGKKTYAHYVEQALGPVGGIAASPFKAFDLASDDKPYRAVEATVPKFAKDWLRAYRYEDEGVLTRRGDPIVERDELSWYEILWKANGMNPDQVRAAYDSNNAKKKIELTLDSRRKALVSGFALAFIQKDQQGKQVALKKIRQWNATNRDYPISSKGLIQAVKMRKRYSMQSDGGVHIKPRLRPRIEEAVAF